MQKQNFKFFGRNFSKILTILKNFEIFRNHDFFENNENPLKIEKSCFQKFSKIFKNSQYYRKILINNFEILFCSNFFHFQKKMMIFFTDRGGFSRRIRIYYQKLQQNSLERTKRILY